jgi:Mrp family chromosome partitioning ATPase
VMRSQYAMPCAGDAERATPGRTLLRTAGWTLGVSAVAGLVTFAALSLPGTLDTAALHRVLHDMAPVFRTVGGTAPQGPKRQPEGLPRHAELEVTSALGGSSRLSLQKRSAISALAATAAALLVLGFTLSRALILSPAITPGVRYVPMRSVKRPRPRGTASFMARTSEPPPALDEPPPPAEPPVLDGIGLSTEQLLAIQPSDPGDAAEAPASRPRPRSNPPATTAKALIEKVLADAQMRDPEALPRDLLSASSLLPRGSAPNDLRSYLQQPTALRTPKPAAARRIKRERRDGLRQEGIRPALKSFEAVLTHVRARATANPAGAILIAAGTKGLDVTGEAIRVARILLASAERGVLVDLSRGRAAVSGRLALPRAPGFADLLAGRAGFEEVIHVDGETALQVIPAGHPTVRSEGNEIGRAVSIFDALAQAYDVVVFHADRDGADQMAPALAGRLSVAVAVLGARGGTSANSAAADLNALGCPLVTYARHDDEGFGRVTAV